VQFSERAYLRVARERERAMRTLDEKERGRMEAKEGMSER
jgi:hypothetical protein